MCRHIAWLGGPRTLADLLIEPQHSLRVQSYAPRRQAHGRLNGDGWGVGYYSPGPLAQVAQRLDPLTRQVELLSRLSEPNKIYAYCFCAAE